MWKQIKKSLPLLLIAALLPACGGGGGGDDGGNDDGGGGTNTSLNYSGETGQATLTSENSEALATAGASGTKQATSSDSIPMSMVSRADAPVSHDEIMQEFAGWVAEVLRGDRSGLAARGVTAERTQDLSGELCDSGSVIIEYPDSGTAGNWSIVFDQCTRSVTYGSGSYSSTFDGTVEGVYTDTGSGYRLELRYVNFTVSVHSSTVNYTDTFNMSMTCTGDNEGTTVSCDYYADYHGYDDRTYRVSDVTVSGDASSGYSVSVRVYDPDYGYVTVTTEVPVTFGCSDGRPDAGRIRMTGANGTVATVEFISCTQYVVTFENVGTTYTWP